MSKAGALVGTTGLNLSPGLFLILMCDCQYVASQSATLSVAGQQHSTHTHLGLVNGGAVSLLRYLIAINHTCPYLIAIKPTFFIWLSVPLRDMFKILSVVLQW